MPIELLLTELMERAFELRSRTAALAAETEQLHAEFTERLFGSCAALLMGILPRLRRGCTAAIFRLSSRLRADGLRP
jgi:hypothetical protein